MNPANTPVARTPVPEGGIVANKYRVMNVLGEGGMGVVVAAYHLTLHAKVAIKFLLPHVAKDQEAVLRFLREARAAIQIQSEHVARVLDVDTLDDGTPYIVMEYLEGRDLSEILRTNGALPAEQAVAFVVQVCEALSEAHAVGIIHRDLKPANLFLTERRSGTQSVKILDFGVSKLGTGSGSISVTRANILMGSPLYMSPEQFVSARNADARSDIWALGVILYELLAGTSPFREDSLPALCRAVVYDIPVPLSTLRSALSPALISIVERCLAKNPGDRYQTVLQLANALEAVTAEWATTARGAATNAGQPSSLRDSGAAEKPSTTETPSAAQEASSVAIPAQSEPQGAAAGQPADPLTLGGMTHTAGVPMQHARWTVAALLAGIAVLVGGVLLARSQWFGDPSPAPGTSPVVASAHEEELRVARGATSNAASSAVPRPSSSRPIVEVMVPAGVAKDVKADPSSSRDASKAPSARLAQSQANTTPRSEAGPTLVTRDGPVVRSTASPPASSTPKDPRAARSGRSLEDLASRRR